MDSKKLLKKAASGLDRLTAEQYADRVAGLPEHLRKVADCFAARVPLDDVIDDIAVRLHAPRPGPPTAADVRRAHLELVHLIREIRNRLEL